MKISLIGPGNAGGAILNNLKNHGFDVLVGDRHPEKHADAVSIPDAINSGEIIILAVPYAAGVDLAKEYKENLKNKIVVDMMNPLKSDMSGWMIFDGKSGAENLQSIIPESKVIETFNHQNAVVLSDPNQAFMYVIGNDETSVNEITELANKMEFTSQPIYDLNKTQSLEAYAYLWIYFTDMTAKNPKLTMYVK